MSWGTTTSFTMGTRGVSLVCLCVAAHGWIVSLLLCCIFETWATRVSSTHMLKFIPSVEQCFDGKMERISAYFFLFWIEPTPCTTALAIGVAIDGWWPAEEERTVENNAITALKLVLNML